MSEKFTAVAINGSPHQGFGNTGQMVAMLRTALASQGCELEEIFLSDLHIEYCTGCAMCLTKGSCWISDDHRALVQKLISADSIILASPVYFFHVTAQMKTFVDRSLGFGHRPLGTWKPGLAVSVSAGCGETSTAQYLGHVMRSFGAYCVGHLTAIAVAPGQFLGKEAVEIRASDLSRDLAAAVAEKRRYPATDRDLDFWRFIGGLAKQNQELMKADHDHWEKLGLYDSFEAYVDQQYSVPTATPETMKQWLKELIRRKRASS